MANAFGNLVSKYNLFKVVLNDHADRRGDSGPEMSVIFTLPSSDVKSSNEA